MNAFTPTVSLTQMSVRPAEALNANKNMRSKQKPPYDVIRHAGIRISEKARYAALQSLPTTECVLSGEVLDVWPNGDRWLLTLLDAKEELTFRATLPRSEDRPLVGHTIGIVGRYDVELDEVDAALQLVFSATCRAPWWIENPSGRLTARMALLEELQAQYPERASLAKRPHLVAIVTSGASASLQDFAAGLGQYAKDITPKEVLVPLEKADAESIADGIRKAAAHHPDVIVVMRGGGRRVMLQRFSDASVVRAVADVGSRIPIVVAVGHERDKVDSEWFAWRRASTPYTAGTIIAGMVRKHVWLEKKDRGLVGVARPAEKVWESPPREDDLQASKGKQLPLNSRNADVARGGRRWASALKLGLALLWLASVCVGGVVGWKLRGSQAVVSTNSAPSETTAEESPQPAITPTRAPTPVSKRSKRAGVRRQGGIAEKDSKGVPPPLGTLGDDVMPPSDTPQR